MAKTPVKKPATQIQATESFGLGFPTTEQPDLEKGIVRGVKIVGLESKNGRDYPGPVIQSAIRAGVYEGAKVNIDHGGNPTTARGYRDRFGVIRNAEYREAEGGFGDFHFNPKHQLAEQFIWDVRNNPSSLGFSHNATLKLNPKTNQRGRVVVEQIVAVRHVDLVADPATTKSLFESDNTMEMTIDLATFLDETTAMKFAEIVGGDGDQKGKVESIVALLSKLVEAPAEPPTEKPPTETEGQTVLQNQIKTLTDQLEAMTQKEKAAETKASILAALESAGLDPLNPAQVSEVFSKQLFATEAEADRATLIADRAALVKSARGQSPKSKSAHTVNATEGASPVSVKNWIKR